MPDAPDETLELTPEPAPDLTLSDVRGLDPQLDELEQTILQSVRGDVAPGMRLLSTVVHGPVGGGKRRLANAVAGTLGAEGFDYAYFHTLGEVSLRPGPAVEQLLRKARDQQPVTIVLDCFDETHFDQAAVRAFSQGMDEIRTAGDEVVVVAVIDSHDLFGDAMVRFLQTADTNCNVERPDLDRRRAILSETLSMAADATDAVDPDRIDVARVARETEQFGVDDLYNLARRAVLAAGAGTGPDPPLSAADVSTLVDQVDDERLQKIADDYTLSDIDVPDVTFADVGGLDGPKRKLTEQVERTLAAEGVETRHSSETSGVLLHGPPGTGKTMLVQALANELDYTLIPVNGPAMKSPHGGGPGTKLPELFERAERNSPAILFFDEFDTLGGQRGTRHEDETAVNTLLTELDGLDPRSNIVVIGATNLPELLDPALLRPGRFDYHVEVPTPDRDAQAEIFAIQSDPLPLAPDVDGAWFARMTDTVTGADIATICERAVAVATRERDAADLELTRDDFEIAYEEFEAGRLRRDDLATDRSPAFR